MVYKPTLTYPIGGESIHDSPITITWTGQASSDGRGYEYEIFYTDVYNVEEEPDWIQIATVPGSSSSYVWNIPSQIRSSLVRVAVRTKSYRGERSDFSLSTANFSIRRHNLIVPALLSPVSGLSYDKYIEIIPDFSSIQGTYSQRSYLHLYYSSNKANIPLTALAEDVPVYTPSITWNTIQLVPANDYVLYVSLADDEGNVSDTVQIKDIQIAHQGYFIVDTTPPVASITVNNDEDFTKNQDVSVNIISYDESTGVHSMQLIEGTSTALPEPVANVKSFTLSSTDGVKVVELLLQDFGANRNNNQIYRLFDTVLSGSNPIVDAAYLNDGSLWVLVGTEKSLYQVTNYPNLMLTLSNEPTAIANYNNQIYIATIDTENQGTLNRYTGASAIEIITGFELADSNITTMVTHNGFLYLGMENGSVYVYDGATVSFVDELDNPIATMNSDGSSLYLALANDNRVYVLNNGNFVEVS